MPKSVRISLLSLYSILFVFQKRILEFRFRFLICDTAVLHKWYWSFSYVGLRYYLCVTAMLLQCTEISSMGWVMLSS